MKVTRHEHAPPLFGTRWDKLSMSFVCWGKGGEGGGGLRGGGAREG